MPKYNRIKSLWAKRYDITREYKVGDFVKIALPSKNGGNNVYRLECTADTTGGFDPKAWLNLRPKFHIIFSEENLKGMALTGDTIYYNMSFSVATEYTPISKVFPPTTTDIPFVGGAVPAITADTSFTVRVGDYHVDPTTSEERYYLMPVRKSGMDGTLPVLRIALGVTAAIQAVIDVPVTPYATETPSGVAAHLMQFDNLDYTWGSITAPQVGNAGTDVIGYTLPNNQGDYQWFEITNNAGVLDVVQHPVNTDI